MEEQPSYKIIERLKVAHTKVELRDDGIIQFFYGDNITYTMKETEELENAVIKITKGVVHKSLRIAGKFSNIDIEVMKYLSRGKGTLFTLADSFVLHSMAQKLLANFYLKINKPVLPTKFFTEITEADQWLQSLDKEELKRMHKLKIMQFY